MDQEMFIIENVDHEEIVFTTPMDEDEQPQDVLIRPLNPEANVLFAPILLGLLGNGGFGKFFLAENGRILTGNRKRLFTVRVIDKNAITSDTQYNHFYFETKILQSINHVFVTKLLYRVQTESKILLVTDFYSGGSFNALLYQVGGRLLEKYAAFYLAEAYLGMEYLHSKQIAFGDFGSSNIAVTCEGHIILSNFSNCKALDDVSLYEDRVSFGELILETVEMSLDDLYDGQQRMSSKMYHFAIMFLENKINEDNPVHKHPFFVYHGVSKRRWLLNKKILPPYLPLPLNAYHFNMMEENMNYMTELEYLNEPLRVNPINRHFQTGTWEDYSSSD